MIAQRDKLARSVADLMRRDNATYHTLVRANPLTCPVHPPGRTSIPLACPTCGGTGYLGGQASDRPNIATLGAPYNTLHCVFGEIQDGHGVRGAGGLSSYADGDRGSQALGDAVFFFPEDQREPVTGLLIKPEIGRVPRPDRIIRTEDQQLFTVLHSLDEGLGTMPIYRAVALGIGTQGSGEATVPN